MNYSILKLCPSSSAYKHKGKFNTTFQVHVVALFIFILNSRDMWNITNTKYIFILFRVLNIVYLFA